MSLTVNYDYGDSSRTNRWILPIYDNHSKFPFLDEAYTHEDDNTLSSLDRTVIFLLFFFIFPSHLSLYDKLDTYYREYPTNRP